MIVSDIITRVRRTFGDESAVQVDDADIIRWINDGQIEIVKNNDQALQTTSFQNLVAGQSTYTLPTDLLLLRTLRFKYSDSLSFNRLIYKNMQQLDETMDGWDGSAYTSGVPIYFTMFEGKALLFPTPDQSSTNGLKVLYNKQPVDVVTSGDSPGLPLVYHNTLVEYCLWQASLLDEAHEVAVMYKGNFMEGVGVLTENENKDPNDKYPTITVLEDDL